MYKRIKEGLTLADAKEIISKKENFKYVYLMIKVFNYSRDTFGNPTAHYKCRLVIEYNDSFEFHDIVDSGHYRQQTGGSERIPNDAFYCLEKLGYQLSEKPTETTMTFDCYKILNI